MKLEKIAVISFIMALIVVVTSCQIKNNFEYGLKNVPNIDNDLITADQINQIMEKCNYVGPKTTCFSSVPLFAKPSLYNEYWVLKIMDNLGVDYSKLNCNQSEFAKYLSDNNLDNIRMTTYIYSKLNINYDKNGTISEVLRHYDANTNLFFFKSNSEKITDKIAATNIALSIFCNMNVLETVDELEHVRNKIIELYGDDDYFKTDNINDSLINNGGIIIEMLLQLGIHSEDLSINKTEWAAYWNANYSSQIGDDYYSFFIFNRLGKINDFFHTKRPESKSLFENILNQQESFFGMGYNKIDNRKECYNIEPQYLYLVTNECKVSNLTFPFAAEMNIFINESIENNFTKSSDITPAIDDNYYGIAIANKYNVRFNSDKMKLFLENIYTYYFEEDSSICDHEKLYNIYYLVLSYFEMNIEIPKKDLLLSSIEKYLTGIDFSNSETLKNTLSDFSMGLEIFNMLKSSYGNSLKVKSKELVNYSTTNQVAYSTIDNISNINKIMILANYKDRVIQTTILKEIDKLKISGGYMQKLATNGDSDINSTVIGCDIKDYYKQFNETDKSDLKAFLFSLKQNNMYKLSPSGTEANLRSYYNMMYVNKYLCQ